MTTAGVLHDRSHLETTRERYKSYQYEISSSDDEDGEKGEVCFLISQNLYFAVNQGVHGKCTTNKATPTRTTPFSKEKGAALGGTRTHDTLLTHYFAMLLYIPLTK